MLKNEEGRNNCKWGGVRKGEEVYGLPHLEMHPQEQSLISLVFIHCWDLEFSHHCKYKL